MTDSSDTIFLICLIARLLQGRRHIAIGANLPIPATAALLARDLSAGATKVSILGSRKYSHFTRQGDLFDFAAQGRLDGFFLSPGQIDGHGNINLVGIGEYPRLHPRWPGSHGSPLLYMTIPNIILFRDVHKKRTFVPNVDFISAPGTSAPNVYRPGGPSALVTDLCHFSFQRSIGRFRLEGVHPGHTLAEVQDNTGFDFDRPETVTTTAPPAPDMVAALRERVASQVADVYPHFAAALRTKAESNLTTHKSSH
jgi:glutaconate CoA-transferase subunit B